MKTTFLSLLLWCIGIVAAGAQNLCDAPPAVRAFYENDARQLAVRMMQNNPQWQDSVAIPDVLYERAMSMLLAVYNATQLPERDTVVECLAIHTFPSIWPYSVIVAADANETWAQKYEDGIFPTGNTAFDGLITQYNLVNDGSFQIGSSIFFSIVSEKGLNPTALVALFEDVPGVNFAELDGIFGDGNNIQLQETLTGDVEMTYTVAWGDCPAGCIFERSWKFRVKTGCGVQFLGVSGNELTQEISCSNSFECATEPLCLDWLRDTVAFYQGQFPDCNLPNYGSAVTVMNNGSVIGLDYVIGADFEFTRFYLCDGTYLGQCLITIAGETCDDPIFQQYLADADTIWTCDQPYPTPEECGVLRAPEPPSWAASVQITPNPSSGMVQVSALFGQTRKGSVQVLNVLGQTVLNKNFQSAFLNESIDLQGSAPGVYFVRVQSGGEQVVRKVVVER
ncbi:MAG: T9SS type A sorting domain-containing protein [Lewinellaceae bacterium]|nr:T9SS type A sorting domain-containing protein [Lewinellaceae bacterium]